MARSLSRGCLSPRERHSFGTLAKRWLGFTRSTWVIFPKTWRLQDERRPGLRSPQRIELAEGAILSIVRAVSREVRPSLVHREKPLVRSRGSPLQLTQCVGETEVQVSS